MTIFNSRKGFTFIDVLVGTALVLIVSMVQPMYSMLEGIK